MHELNILFTSAGRRVSLLQQFRRALTDLEIPGRLITTDLRKNAPAAFVADENEIVPRVTDDAYIPALLDICRRHRITLIVPLIDTELHLLSPCRERFAQMGATLLTCSTETNEICRDKRNTARFFQEVGVSTPAILDPGQVLADPHATYPLLIKPADGSCSIGVTRVRNARELEFFKDYVPNAILQELLLGEEYTMDVLVDFRGRVRTVVPRLRIETRAGEVSKGMTVKHPGIMAETRKVVEGLPGALGCVTVQCFLTAAGRIAFTEINPRFGGGAPLAFEAGADFPRWILEMMSGRDPDIVFDGWRDGVVMLRYDEAVFTTKDRIA